MIIRRSIEENNFLRETNKKMLTLYYIDGEEVNEKLNLSQDIINNIHSIAFCTKEELDSMINDLVDNTYYDEKSIREYTTKFIIDTNNRDGKIFSILKNYYISKTLYQQLVTYINTLEYSSKHSISRNLRILNKCFFKFPKDIQEALNSLKKQHNTIMNKYVEAGNKLQQDTLETIQKLKQELPQRIQEIQDKLNREIEMLNV